MKKRVSRKSRPSRPRRVRPGRRRGLPAVAARERPATSGEPIPLLSQDPPLNAFDRWIRFLDRSPRARWLFYLALPATLLGGLHAAAWLCGDRPAFQLGPDFAMTSVISVLMVGSIHYLIRVAGRSLLRFRPALATDEAEFRRHHHAITTTPTPVLPAALVVGPAFFYLTRVTDPTFFGMLGAGACYRVPLLLAGYVNTAFIVLGTILSVRYLGLIRRLHARAPVVNLFERGPLFAFSTLSSRLAFIYAAFSYAFVLAFPSSLRNLPTVAYLLGINLPLILIIFIYPLYGMHVRMVEEKQRLLEDSARRIQSALAAFQSKPAPRAPAGVDPHRRLTSLIEEESYLRKIPTWPWEPGTLTAVLTAVFLPLMLVVAQQVVSRYFAG